jgi:hypothetical protein
VLHEDSIVFYNFKLGNFIRNKEVTVRFNFDQNKKFYSFNFEIRRRTTIATDLIYEDGEYLTDVFKDTYGKPSKCYQPDIATVPRELLCEWNHKDLTIFTSIDYKSSFFVVGHVGSKKLENEYIAYKKQQENKGSVDGAFAEEKQAPQSKDTQKKQYGFQDIPFGASYEEVNKKLTEMWEKTHKEDSYSEPLVGRIMGNAKIFIQLDKNSIGFNHFKLGNRELKVVFWFDHNKKFYSFYFKTGHYTADFFSQAYIEGEYLTDVFTNKYGKPSKCYKPTFIDVRSDKIAFLCKWNHKDLEIFTGISSEDATFYATAYVASKKLEKEYNSYKKQQENKSAIDGAKKF